MLGDILWSAVAPLVYCGCTSVAKGVAFAAAAASVVVSAGTGALLL